MSTEEISALQWLRLEEGFKSARQFAVHIGFSESSYTRYEKNPEDIPMHAAWKLADYYSCPIDVIVGRESIEDFDSRDGAQRFFDALSPSSKQLFNEFKRFLQARELEIRKRELEGEDDKYLQAAKSYERMMYAEAPSLDIDGGGFYEKLVFGGNEMRRDCLRKYIEHKFEESAKGLSDGFGASDPEAVIEKILAAYARIQPAERGDVDYEEIAF